MEARQRLDGDVLRLRTAGLTWRNVAGELIVFDLDRSVHLAANDTGAVLWETLYRGATRDALVTLLLERYSVAQADAGVDVDDFLAHLVALELIET